MKKTNKKLALSSSTVRALTSDDLERSVGGHVSRSWTSACPVACTDTCNRTCQESCQAC